MEASPSSRSDSFSRARCKPRSLDADAALGESFSSSTASFIDMDPEELFSMRWTSSDDAGFDLGLLPRAGACSPLLARDDASAGSSPAFHTAQSTPASAIGAARRPGGGGGGAKTLLATRRLLLRYLRFLVPLCRKARALRVAPARVFSAPRSRAALAATPARRSTSSAAEYWCHGNADTAVRDAILHCKRSLVAYDAPSAAS